MDEFLKERWLALVLSVLAIVFIAQNPDDTTINFFWLHVRWPLWLTLTIVAVVGVAIGWFLNSRRTRSGT